MKRILWLFILIFSFVQNAYSGNLFYTPYYRYHHQDIQENNLILGIYPRKDELFGNKTVDTSKLINLMILDLETKSEKYIFPESNKETVKFLVFEEAYDSEAKKMKYNIDTHIDIFVNNFDLEMRLISDSFIIQTQIENSTNTKLWRCKRDGSELQQLTELKKDDEYILDVKKQKIIAVHHDGYETKFEYFPY